MFWFFVTGLIRFPGFQPKLGVVGEGDARDNHKDLPSRTTSGVLAAGAEKLHFPAGKVAGQFLDKRSGLRPACPARGPRWLLLEELWSKLPSMHCSRALPV